MSAPTEAHERRVADLLTLATLAGFTADLAIEGHLRPDVVRANFSSRRFFLGDAKETESPGCANTRRRLLRYARAARAWTCSGEGVVIALAFKTPAHARGWLHLLAEATRVAGFDPTSARVCSVESGCVIVAVEATSLNRNVSGRQYGLGSWPDDAWTFNDLSVRSISSAVQAA
jgi:hypothetical protein